MQKITWFATAVLWVALAAVSTGQDRFEALAWVDHFDFAGARKGNHFLFDTETSVGIEAILHHVGETGATTILWRNCGGATMRYQSRVESHHQDAPFDKRRLPDNRPVYGWLRYGEVEPDILRQVFADCRRQGWVGGVHWPFEENHWASWTLGGWNLDHPQYWCRTTSGLPWAGRCSIAYPEVLEHKLALLDELVERGMSTLFIDTWRSGAWTPADEYVPPVVDAWKSAHNGENPPMNPRDEAWCRHVSTYVTNLMRRIRERLDRSGQHIRFLVGAFGMTGDGRSPLRERGLDWPLLVREGVIDGLVVQSVPWNARHPFASTRTHYRNIIAAVAGRCDVYFPVRAYDYAGYGMPSYAKASGLKQADIAARLVRLAWEEGGAGISMECVDYNNYAPETRRVVKGLLEGECRWRHTPKTGDDTPQI